MADEDAEAAWQALQNMSKGPPQRSSAQQETKQEPAQSADAAWDQLKKLGGGLSRGPKSVTAALHGEAPRSRMYVEVPKDEPESKWESMKAPQQNPNKNSDEDQAEDPRIGAAESKGGASVDAQIWRKAFEQRAKMYSDARQEVPNPSAQKAPEAPTAPDEMYPARRDPPNTQSSPYPGEGGDSWKSLYGPNAPPTKGPDPLPPIGPVFFFRVIGQPDEQPVYDRPMIGSEKVGTRHRGEVVRVVDFQGAWARLAYETEAQAEEKWVGWMMTDDGEQELLEEIEDPLEHEKEYTKNLFRRVHKINDHVAARLRDRGDRAMQYLNVGRVPPGRKAELPEGTRCVNAFWGIEARWVKLAPGEEYWPQGALTLPPSYVKGGWEQPKEEARCGHWRVFAARPFGAHELIEVCPLVPIDLQTCIASFQLRMNIVETPADEDAAVTGKTGRVRCHVPLGYGMMYQQSIELEDLAINWTPVTNFNCKMIPVNGHMYIYATRKIQADEELILEYKRCFRTDQGEPVDFTGFTPYWHRQDPPENFAKALVTPHGPRKVRPIPGQVKFGTSKLHDRGTFADANFKKGEILEMCPCFLLDVNGADCMQDYCFDLPEVRVDIGNRSVIKRTQRYIMPLGYGGIYNHLDQGNGANVTWYYDETTQCCVFVADPNDETGEIPRNRELCFDYGDAYWETPSRRWQRPRTKEDKADNYQQVSQKRLVVGSDGSQHFE